MNTVQTVTKSKRLEELRSKLTPLKFISQPSNGFAVQGVSNTPGYNRYELYVFKVAENKLGVNSEVFDFSNIVN